MKCLYIEVIYFELPSLALFQNYVVLTKFTNQNAHQIVVPLSTLHNEHKNKGMR